jgi:two-component system, cell cycle sensor histidine kinase and response regulator CckA
LLAFARRQVLERRSLGLNELIKGTTTLIGSIISEEIELELRLAKDLALIYADPIQIEQVMMNLCINARDAMPNGGTLTISTGNTEITEEILHLHPFARPGRYVLCTVSDTGIGMDAATMDKIFEPFFTTKEVGRGTGLGLATVYGIIKQHNGFILVDSTLSQGTTFRIYLPQGSGDAEQVSVATSTVGGKGTETILVAEDHEQLRELAYEALTADGYQVLAARNGKEALQFFQEKANEIRLVILDVVMPQLGGPASYAEMSKIKPGLPVVFTTGHSMELADLTQQIENGARFLQKPYMPRALGQAVRDVLDRTEA